MECEFKKASRLGGLFARPKPGILAGLTLYGVTDCTAWLPWGTATSAEGFTPVG